MGDLQKYRSARKGVLTRAYGNLDVMIEERDYDELISERTKLKTLYKNFTLAHNEFHATLN